MSLSGWVVMSLMTMRRSLDSTREKCCRVLFPVNLPKSSFPVCMWGWMAQHAWEVREPMQTTWWPFWVLLKDQGYPGGCWIVLSSMVLAKIAWLTSMQESPGWRCMCWVHYCEYQASHSQNSPGLVLGCPAAPLEVHEKSSISLYKENPL